MIKERSWAAAEQTESLDCYQSDVSFHRSSCSVIGVFLTSLCVHPLPLPSLPHSSLLLCLLSPLQHPHLLSSCALFFFKALLQTFPPFGLHPLSLQLGEPQHLQTSKQSRGCCYHQIMRLSAAKLKEAISAAVNLLSKEG